MGGAIRAGFGDGLCFSGSGGDGLAPEIGGDGAGLPLEMGGDGDGLLGGGLRSEVGGGGAGLLGAGLGEDGVGFPGRGGMFWLEGILGMGFGGGGLKEGVAVGGGDSAPVLISKLRTWSLILDGATGVGESDPLTPLATPFIAAGSPSL